LPSALWRFLAAGLAYKLPGVDDGPVACDKTVVDGGFAVISTTSAGTISLFGQSSVTRVKRCDRDRNLAVLRVVTASGK
jgi:hypothetical protein